MFVFSKSFEQRVDDFRKILQRVSENNMKLHCLLFKQQVKSLGWIVSADGYTVDPDSTKAVKSYLQ